ncbi:TIGR01459 family HAD-type hydrolase [Tabrizicola oligotrophica]|uniref:TIGR01459 family HAD-type hydrolase n=1 Tax=Tabrizicola oligotrophica TaxID=2710650 RepID=A0A6M0QV41_9RHOB|nr:TIGR01459 family HAD-type hydrolase [Tabrizicola oligotrophica]NEY90724.1 TIGR01459 family HAD-type hydrolase [Tabrizicola oligotrophica]
MTQLISSLAEIADRYDALFCDLWGCLHNGKTPFPEAVSALKGFRAGGSMVALVTNAPRPNATVIAQLDRMGVPRDAWDLVVSSGDAAQSAMLEGAVGRRVFHIGAAKDEDFFTVLPPGTVAPERVTMQEAEGIVCTGLVDDLTETPDDYRAQLLLGKTRGLPLLCANPDIIVDLGDKRLYCAGALAQAYETMGGTALYFGKPHPPIYDLARRQLGLEYPRILCVGDGIATDIQGGMAEGLDTLFITGGIAAAAFGPDAARPDKALLEAWIAGQQIYPTWAMPHLG